MDRTRARTGDMPTALLQEVFRGDTLPLILEHLDLEDGVCHHTP